MDERAWDIVDRLVEWIDESSQLSPETERLLRLMKLSEEVGEVAQAVIGVTGQNPRKGVTHTWDDVQAELCDVILTAMVALATFNPDARRHFAEHLDRVADRAFTPGTAAARSDL
jgi:NTP pyrophosphatase (non-canonical NTP hydrolase)